MKTEMYIVLQKGEGLELQATTISSKTTPAFLADNKTLPLPIPHAWASIVNGYWSDLVRDTNRSALCPDTVDGCESSLIPLNHTFVVPGGRFREQCKRRKFLHTSLTSLLRLLGLVLDC